MYDLIGYNYRLTLFAAISKQPTPFKIILND